MSLPPPLASIRVVTPDGHWSPEALQFLLGVTTFTQATADTADGAANEVLTLEQQVAANLAAVTALEGRVDTTETDITANAAAITALAARVTQNEADIAANTAAIAALDVRVTALEP